MNLFSVSFFLLNDGFVLLMTSVQDSFRLLPPGTLLTEIHYAAVFDWLTNSLSLSLLFCMPVLIILFISEVSLGHSGPVQFTTESVFLITFNKKYYCLSAGAAAVSQHNDDGCDSAV